MIMDKLFIKHDFQKVYHMSSKWKALVTALEINKKLRRLRRRQIKETEVIKGINQVPLRTPHLYQPEFTNSDELS